MGIDGKGYLGMKEAAAYLGVTRATIERWIQRNILKPDGRLPGLKGRILFKQASLDAFVQSNLEVDDAPEGCPAIVNAKWFDWSDKDAKKDNA